MQKMAKRTNTTTAEKTLERLLTDRTFDQLLQNEDLYDIQGASRKTGFSGWHLRRLCQARKLPHIMRSGRQYFFLPAHLKTIFKVIAARV